MWRWAAASAERAAAPDERHLRHQRPADLRGAACRRCSRFAGRHLKARDPRIQPIVGFEEGLQHTLDWCRTEHARPLRADRAYQPIASRDAARRSFVYAPSIPTAVAMMTGPMTSLRNPNADPAEQMTNTSRLFI